jgi:hypothetical protein
MKLTKEERNEILYKIEERVYEEYRNDPKEAATDATKAFMDWFDDISAEELLKKEKEICYESDWENTEEDKK